VERIGFTARLSVLDLDAAHDDGPRHDEGPRLGPGRGVPGLVAGASEDREDLDADVPVLRDADLAAAPPGEDVETGLLAGELRLGEVDLPAAAEGADVASLATKLYLKPATACSALLLTLLGLPFAFRYGRRGAVAGIGVAILLGLTYFFVTSLFVKLGEAGALPPVLAAWSANTLFGLGAAYGLLGVRT